MHLSILSRSRPPKWAAMLYIVLAVALIPWIAYLAVSLPTRHISRHWDLSWVGMDIAIAALLIMNGVLSYIRSIWLIMTSTATGVLLCVDAWFDVLSARPGRALIGSFAAALFIELPLATMSFMSAIRLLRTSRNT